MGAGFRVPRTHGRARDQVWRRGIRNLIVGFAWLAPAEAIALWIRWPLAGLGVLALSHALLLYPTLLPNVQWLGPVNTSFATDQKEVWLTIDDGPTADTPALLDLIESYGTWRATFFLKGSLATQHPDLVREILARGHGVGNHSHTHPSATFWCRLPRSIASEIDRCNAALGSISGMRPTLFRAPVGMKNPAVHPLLATRNMRLVGWTVRGFDSVSSDSQSVAHRILRRVQPGAIVVMHQGRPHSLQCIATVLSSLQVLGYSCVIPSEDRLLPARPAA